VLWAAAEKAADEPLPELLERRVYRPLGMLSTGFRHGKPCPTCAPSSPLHPASPARLHDPPGRRLGGIAGHAGLFSTGADLARFAMMFANQGELEGVRVFRAATVQQFTRRQPRSGTRALGWDTPNAMRTSSAGTRMSTRAFGHTGHTGGSMWIDPERGVWAVLIGNRTYNREAGEAGVQALRRVVNDLAAEAADAGF
jgi:CubicO group peptidase (beta-lactamase class C family)